MTRMWLLITGAFVVNQSKEDIFDRRGLRDVVTATKLWRKLAKKITKMVITLVASDTSMHSWVLRLGLCHREFIGDTRVHKEQSGVTMATNFGTRITINANKCISTRYNENAITYKRGFCGLPSRRHFWLQGSKERCHGIQFLTKIGKNVTKMAITSVVCNISAQSLVLRQGLCYRGIRLWHSRTQGTKGLYYGNQFWD